MTIGAWIESLPRPTGLVCCNDVWAGKAIAACRARGVDVPDESAVIGVDDDPIFCKVSDTPLTSVDPNTFKIGNEAAAMLHGMMRGMVAPPPLTTIDPAGVVTRRSTDMLAFADADVAGVVRSVRDAACDGLTIGRLVRKLGVSRRKLERMFAEHVGHSPSEEVSQMRLRRVQQLLVETDIGVDEIARVAGFAYAETMRRAFKARYGVAPRTYRRRQRPGATVASRRTSR
jgi:LacI family transcriptional regulator